jgi:hypothetical protein
LIRVIEGANNELLDLKEMEEEELALLSRLSKGKVKSD